MKDEMMTERTPNNQSLLTVRAALIFVTALLIGGGVTTLSLLASDSWTAAVLAGAMAFGCAVATLNKIIG
jgi:hypothetical protein